MSECFLPRRICALLAAYLIALQSLLVPLSVPAGASFDGSLCGAASTNTSRVPGSHDSGYPCAAGCSMSCCAQALDGLPRVIAWEATEARTPATPVIIAPPVRPAIKGPQIPRAPPG